MSENFEHTPFTEKVKNLFADYFSLKFFIIGIVLGLILGGIILGGKKGQNTTTNVYTVNNGYIEDAVEVYGNAELVNEQQLRFTQQGEVKAIYFKDGDTIKKGDIIAILDTESIENEILQAEINLENAKIDLQDKKDGSTEYQILQAKSALEQSKSALALAEKEYEDLLEDYNSNETLNNKETTLKSAVLDIKDYIIQGERSILKLDVIFGATPKYESQNDSFEIYLSAKNTEYKRDTMELILSAYKKLELLKTEYGSLSGDLDGTLSGSTRENTLYLLNLCSDLYDIIYKANDAAFNALENSVSCIDLTEATISSYQATVSSNGSMAKNSQTNILNTINKISNLDSSNDEKLRLEAKENEINKLKDTIALQEINLEDVLKGNKESLLKIAENTVRQREIALSSTRKNMDNFKIKAPFDGIVRKIDFKVGDKITAADTKYVYLENPNLVEIVLLLDQIDIVKIEEGMDTEIEFDAYPGLIFKGTLSEINTTPSISAGVVSYQVKISMDKGNTKIYGGMTANVKIIAKQKDNIIKVPVTYIEKNGDKNFITNIDGEKIEVVLGIENNNMVEVISGLEAGDKIIKQVSNVNNTYFGMTEEEMSNMNGMGM